MSPRPQQPALLFHGQTLRRSIYLNLLAGHNQVYWQNAPRDASITREAALDLKSAVARNAVAALRSA